MFVRINVGSMFQLYCITTQYFRIYIMLSIHLIHCNTTPETPTDHLNTHTQPLLRKYMKLQI